MKIKNLYSKYKSKYQYFPAQRETLRTIIYDSFKYYVLNIARGGAKSVTLTELALYYSLKEVNDILIVSKTIPQVKKVFVQIKDRIKDTPFVESINLTDRIIRFNNGSKITFKGAEKPDNLRGQNEHTIVICDEFAFFHKDCWNDALRQICGIQKVKKVVIASTPNGHNDFYNLARLAQEDTSGRYKYISYNYTQNPYGQSPEDVEAAKKTMVKWKFLQEYEGVFHSSGFSVFDDIDKFCSLPTNIRFDANRQYAGGLDIGLKNDYTVLSVIDDLGSIVYLERFTDVSNDVWVAKIKKVISDWNIKVLVAEENYESTLLTLIKNPSLKIYPFRTSASNKTPLIESLLIDVDYGLVRCIDLPIIKDELRTFTKIDTRNGYTYRAREGHNDDIPMSIALSNYARNNYLIRKPIKVL